MGRSQKVRIGKSLSPSLKLVSGVPQGGTLSPIIFTVYTADLEQWVCKSQVYNYADDTTSDIAHRQLELVIKWLEADANAILKFMASNGLVANQKKTVFMLLNHKMTNKEAAPIQIRVGDNLVTQEKSSKLLGMTIEDNLGWKEHFYGKNGLINALNKRLFAIGRVANQIPKEKLTQLAHALWMSKLRYGLQLCTNVRTDETERKNCNMKSLQIAQNKLMRKLANKSFWDRTSTCDLLMETDLLSVNQLAASIKLCEVWKSENVPNYPVKLEPNISGATYSERNVRPKTNRKYNQDANSTAEKESFSRNSAKLWNAAPESLKMAKTLRSAKNEIKTNCKNLPV